MKKDGKFFLGYSILLFSVAFILILFSSFTGMRYHEAQDEKNQLYQGAQKSVVMLTEENEELEEENEEKDEEIQNLKAKNIELDRQLKNEKNSNETVIKNMDTLFEVQGMYNRREYTNAQNKFNTIDRTALSENAKLQYDNLKKKLF